MSECVAVRCPTDDRLGAQQITRRRARFSLRFLFLVARSACPTHTQSRRIEEERRKAAASPAHRHTHWSPKRRHFPPSFGLLGQSIQQERPAAGAFFLSDGTGGGRPADICCGVDGAARAMTKAPCLLPAHTHTLGRGGGSSGGGSRRVAGGGLAFGCCGRCGGGTGGAALLRCWDRRRRRRAAACICLGWRGVRIAKAAPSSTAENASSAAAFALVNQWFEHSQPAPFFLYPAHADRDPSHSAPGPTAGKRRAKGPFVDPFPPSSISVQLPTTSTTPPAAAAATMKRSMTSGVVTSQQQGSGAHCAGEGAECPRRPVAAAGTVSRAARALVLFSSLALSAQGTCDVICWGGVGLLWNLRGWVCVSSLIHGLTFFLASFPLPARTYAPHTGFVGSVQQRPAGGIVAAAGGSRGGCGGGLVGWAGVACRGGSSRRRLTMSAVANSHTAHTASSKAADTSGAFSAHAPSPHAPAPSSSSPLPGACGAE